MSMFGAVDLSSLAPATKPAGSSGGTPSPATGDRPTGAAGSGLPVPLVVDVDASTLRDVAEVSTQVPVIVVLHSPRSQASADLATVLEQLADQYSGRFQLARVNVDTAPEVAQALQAQAVPTVVALIAGQPVPMFQGAVPQEQLRSVIDQLLEVAAANGVNGTIAVDGAAGAGTAEAEPEETEVERAAREAIEAGDFAAAEEVYTHAIAQNPGDDDLKVARNQVRLMARLDGQDPHELLAAADAAPTDLAAALAGAHNIPGRMQRISQRDGRRGLCIVDFAHTPDAMELALKAVRPITPGRLIVVFGSDGDRDQGKRPMLGEVCARLADVLVVTDENPRSEDPQLIRNAILEGVRGVRPDLTDVEEITTWRGDAVRRGVELCGPDDTVIVTGKGHEPFLEMAGEFIRYNDAPVMAEAVEEKWGRA